MVRSRTEPPPPLGVGGCTPEIKYLSKITGFLKYLSPMAEPSAKSTAEFPFSMFVHALIWIVSALLLQISSPF